MEGLRMLRLGKHLSQTELAKILNVTLASVCNWETDKSMPSPKTMKKICEYFGCEKKDLF